MHDHSFYSKTGSNTLKGRDDISQSLEYRDIPKEHFFKLVIVPMQEYTLDTVDVKLEEARYG